MQAIRTYTRGDHAAHPTDDSHLTYARVSTQASSRWGTRSAKTMLPVEPGKGCIQHTLRQGTSCNALPPLKSCAALPFIQSYTQGYELVGSRTRVRWSSTPSCTPVESGEGHLRSPRHRATMEPIITKPLTGASNHMDRDVRVSRLDKTALPMRPACTSSTHPAAA